MECSWDVDSGWTQAISEADVVGPTTANNLLNSEHLKKTRHVHEATVGVLFLLQAEACQQYTVTTQLTHSENRLLLLE